MLNEWGKTCKNSICKFWVLGPWGAYLSASASLDHAMKRVHELDVSRLCEKAPFLLA